MRETQPKSTPERSPAREPWIPGDIQQVLQSEPYHAEDKVCGVGEGHWFGPTGQSRIVFYPKLRAVEFEDGQNYFAIKGAGRITLTEEAVWIDIGGETQTSFYTFDRDGNANVIIKQRPLAPHVAEVLKHLKADPDAIGDDRLSEEKSAEPAVAPSVAPITEPPVSDQVAPWESDSPVEGSGRHRRVDSSAADLGSNSEYHSPQPAKKNNRKEFKGRLGRKPQCKKTQRGKTMTRFPVAEHVKDEAGEDITNWFTVAAFNAIADEVCRLADAEELRVGDEVKVVGYPQIQMVSDGRGGLKEQEVIFAAVVKKPNPKGAKRA